MSLGDVLRRGSFFPLGGSVFLSRFLQYMRVHIFRWLSRGIGSPISFFSTFLFRDFYRSISGIPFADTFPCSAVFYPQAGAMSAEGSSSEVAESTSLPKQVRPFFKGGPLTLTKFSPRVQVTFSAKAPTFATSHASSYERRDHMAEDFTPPPPVA